MSPYLFQYIHEFIIIFGTLCSHSEVVGSETWEIAGIANENAVFFGQIILQFSSSTALDRAEHEVGLRLTHMNAWNIIQGITKSLSLIQISRHVY